MAEKIKITINDKEVEAVKDSTLLQAVRAAGEKVPTLCHHKDLAPDGNCRLCICEIEEAQGHKRIVTSCNYPVREPIKVWTHSEKVVKHRKLLAEMYLSRWPSARPVKAVAKTCGVTETRFRGDHTDDKEEACILCGRCVRACEEFVIEDIVNFAGRSMHRQVTMPFGEVDPHCIGCSSCAYVCPTGAIKIVDDLNHPADAVKIRNAGMKINAEMARLDPLQNRMRQVGTGNIVDVMDQYDILPVMNYKFGSHPEAKKIYCDVFRNNYWTQNQCDGCWLGCSMACAKATEPFELKTGPYKGQKVWVDGPEYETIAGAANMGCFDPEFAIEYNFYCDTYGIDTISFSTCTAFVMEAFEAGQITTEHTGGLELKFGHTAAALELLHQMAKGEGFGVDVGQGIRWLKKKWVAEYGADERFLQDIGMEVKGLEVSEYVTKESLAQQGGYSMAVKGPQHDESWLIFMDMVNNQIPTFEDKAEALYYFPLWRTWFGLFGLCKIIWNDVVPADNYREKDANKVPGHVRSYFRYVEGMLGIDDMSEEKMLEQSARVYNLQRIICRLLGYGHRKDDYPPYRMMGPVTAEEYESRQDRYDKQLKELVKVDPTAKSSAEKVKILRQYREDQYEQMMDVVYKRKGWTRGGIPTLARLKELGIDLPELVEIVRPYQE